MRARVRDHQCRQEAFEDLVQRLRSGQLKRETVELAAELGDDIAGSITEKAPDIKSVEDCLAAFDEDRRRGYEYYCRDCDAYHVRDPYRKQDDIDERVAIDQQISPLRRGSKALDDRALRWLTLECYERHLAVSCTQPKLFRRAHQNWKAACAQAIARDEPGWFDAFLSSYQEACNSGGHSGVKSWCLEWPFGELASFAWTPGSQDFYAQVWWACLMCAASYDQRGCASEDQPRSGIVIRIYAERLWLGRRMAARLLRG